MCGANVKMRSNALHFPYTSWEGVVEHIIDRCLIFPIINCFLAKFLAVNISKNEGPWEHNQPYTFSYSCVDYCVLFIASIADWKRQRNSSAWLHIPIELSHLISKAASLGFTFHHAKQYYSVLNLWLDSSKPSKIPLYGTHQVGVAGEVF